jgi:hypothetical protein
LPWAATSGEAARTARRTLASILKFVKIRVTIKYNQGRDYSVSSTDVEIDVEVISR